MFLRAPILAFLADLLHAGFEGTAHRTLTHFTHLQGAELEGGDGDEVAPKREKDTLKNYRKISEILHQLDALCRTEKKGACTRACGLDRVED